jgi:hypothetical protein
VSSPRYGGKHQAMRKRLLPYAVGSRCVRCGLPISSGQPIDLDHSDDGVAWLGWSHATCNRRAGAIRGNKARSGQRDARRERIKRMLTECCLGIEIAEDRLHTSIAAAGYIDGGLFLVELVAYIPGTDPVAEVLRLQRERQVRAIAIDPRSPGATLVRVLRRAGVQFTEMTSHDVAVAHGTFVDLLNKRRLKVAKDDRLTAAARYAQDRRLGGANALERRGAVVDVSPANSVEFAVWALLSKPPIPRIY